MRATRAAALKGTDDSQSTNHIDLGRRGKVFEFCHVTSNVEFMESDLKKDYVASVEHITNWIEKVM